MSAEHTRIDVPASLTIYEVATLAAYWRELLAANTPDTLCLEVLNEIDAAGFQLLISLAKSLKRLQFKGDIRLPLNADLSCWLEQHLNTVLEGKDHA